MKEIVRQLANLPLADAAARTAARERQDTLTKPQGALGRLEEIAVWLAGWRGDPRPQVARPLVLVFAGNHGIAARGVSAFPGEVTAQMVANFAAGGAAINQLADRFGAALRVIPLDLETPTADFTEAPALTEAEFSAAFFAGVEAVRDADLLLVGEMGIGNTTAAAAICAALHGGVASRWAGPGTGLNRKGVAAKAALIDAALGFHGRALDHPLEVLRRLGGRELAAIAGAVVAARNQRIPVILDGFVATAAVAPLEAAQAGALDHCIAGHGSAEPGHRLLLERLGKIPLVDLGMRLGEASGAAVALAVVQAALAAHNGMATFAEAGVSERDE